MTEALAELRSVAKRFGDRTALAATTLSIERRCTTVLIGPSGCGKSTLLRLVVGLESPDGGEVHVFGERLDRDNAPRLRRRMGYVIQDGGLFPHLTARRNVALAARYFGWERARADRRVDELADLVRIPRDALERYPLELSGGQRQRVALARALALDPDLLLLDEPLGALDPLLRAELQEDLRRIFRELGKAVLLVTHDMAEAAHFGDVIVLLRDGVIVQRGPLADLRERPADEFVTRFLAAQRFAPAERA